MTGKGRDVIVVGGGISGLVAAASLARSGLRVLLVEKNRNCGGSCASFARRGYRFDTGTSSLSGLREGGRLRKIFDALGLSLTFLRPGIRETVVSPRFTLPLPSEAEELEGILRMHFRGDGAALSRLFSLLAGNGPPPEPGTTFGDLLKDCSCSAELSFLLESLLGNLGMPAERVDGGTALAFFREYILDGGYYPKGGMSALPDALVDIIRESGGDVITGAEGASFLTEGGSVRALRLKGAAELTADFFINTAGVRQNSLGTVPAFPSGGPWEAGLHPLTPSTSAFMVFLGLDCRLDTLTDYQGHILSLPEGTMGEVYRSLESDDLLFSPSGYLYIIVPSRLEAGMAPPGGESLCLFVMAPYRDKEFWRAHRERMTGALMARAEKLLPGLIPRIRLAESATPLTVEKFTGACRGATYGWEATPAQSGAGRLSPVTPWDNLTLAGHWTRPGSGISAAAYSGHLAARMVGRSARERGHVPRP